MSDTVAVIPGEIPVFTGNLEELDTRVKALSGGGVTISTATSDVHSSFGGLKAFYEAPEAEQLFATTQPVANTGLSLSSDLCVIAGALGTYSNEVRPLKQKLEDLKREAIAFRAHAAQDDKWREDGDLVEENNTRRDEIRETWTAFQEAERACHNKIVALVGGDALKVNDGSNKDNMYGYDAEALKHAKGLPWGDPVKESTPAWQVWEHAYDFGKGFFVDGVGATIQGLGTLVGFDGWDAMKQAWTGLAQLGTGLVMTAVAGPAFWMTSDEKLPSWLRDSRTAMKETGKALVAWDQWGENPARAAGTVTFNAITVVFTRGAGSAVAGAGKAGTATKALSFVSKAGRAVDPMTYIFKGAGAGLSKISDVLAGLKGTGTIELPPLPDNVFTLPEGAARLPDGTVKLPEGAAIPDGAVRLPDGTVKLPDGVIALPEGTIKLPEDLTPLPEGTVRTPSDPVPAYADMDGNLYKADGSILQRAEDARTEPGKTATDAESPRVETPARIPEMAGVGARGGNNADDVIRLGDSLDNELGDIGRVGEDLPGANQPPDGGFGENVPAGRANDNAPRGNATYSAGGSADSVPHNSHGDGGNEPPRPGSSAADNVTTGGRSGTPPVGDHGVSVSQAVPHQSGGHGGSPNNGSGRSPAAGNGLPEFRDPRKYTPAERQAIMEYQAERARNDPAYRKEYYRKNGYRLDDARADETGLVPPQLIEVPGVGWAPKSELAPPLKPDYLDNVPLKGGREAATPEARAALDELARVRHDAIATDRPFHVEHGNARREFKRHGTDELRAALDEAAENHKGPHNSSTKASEAYGEEVARRHAIPELYPNAKPETLYGPKNGNDQFDQVYKDGDRYIVVEAKSHVDTKFGERLVDGARYSQGSRAYFLDILEQMKSRKRKFPSEGILARDLRWALRDSRVDYIVVRGQDNAGTYTGYSTQKFDIREPS